MMKRFPDEKQILFVPKRAELTGETLENAMETIVELRSKKRYFALYLFEKEICSS